MKISLPVTNVKRFTSTVLPKEMLNYWQAYLFHVKAIQMANNSEILLNNWRQAAGKDNRSRERIVTNRRYWRSNLGLQSPVKLSKRRYQTVAQNSSKAWCKVWWRPWLDRTHRGQNHPYSQLSSQTPRRDSKKLSDVLNGDAFCTTTDLWKEKAICQSHSTTFPLTGPCATSFGQRQSTTLMITPQQILVSFT